MGSARQIAFFATRAEAVAFERRLLAQARANGQVCERWAEIIRAPEGFGVPVKERVLEAVTQLERTRIVDWTPPEKTNGISPIR